MGRLGRTEFNRFVSNNSAEAGKGRRGHPDTPAAVRDLALLALDLENSGLSTRCQVSWM